MASNTKNVQLGVCKLYFDEVDLGYTQGGVEVSVTTDTYKVEIDQFGKTPINEYIQGRQVIVKAPLAETTLANLVATMPGATLVLNGAGQEARVDVTTGVGIDLLRISKALRLHPKSRAEDDLSDDFIVHRTATSGSLQFAYKVDAERVYNTEFMAYPDPVTNKLFSVGTPAIAFAPGGQLTLMDGTPLVLRDGTTLILR